MFRGLVADWRMPPARAWRMLTGVGWQAGALTAEQIQRVEILVPGEPGDAGQLPRCSVGEWMVTPNARRCSPDRRRPTT